MTSKEKQELIDKEYDRVMHKMLELGLRQDEATDFAMEAANDLSSLIEPDWDDPEYKEQLESELHYLWVMSGSRKSFLKFKTRKVHIEQAKENIRY